MNYHIQTTLKWTVMKFFKANDCVNQFHQFQGYQSVKMDPFKLEQVVTKV